MIRQIFGGLAAFGLIVLVGCSDSVATVEAKGLLTWDDGKPIAGASLRLVPKESGKPEVVGFSGKNGEFSLSIVGGKAGAPRGEYTVVVSQFGGGVGDAAGASDKASPEEMAKIMHGLQQKQKMAPPKGEVPAMYSDPEKSPLTLKIDGPNPKIELKLKKS